MGNPAEIFTHISDIELLDYYEQRLPENREQAVEEHLARCDECTRMAREVYAFNRTWERWTAVTHGRAHYREIVEQALRVAESSQPAFGARLQRWRRQWAGSAQAALRVVTEATAGAARVVAEHLDELSRPSGGWLLRPVAIPQAAYGIRGEVSEPDVAVFAAKTPQGVAQASITINAGRPGTVKVRIEGVRESGQGPLVLLVKTDAPTAPSVLIQRADAADDADYGIARFADIQPGEYLVVIEPFEGEAAAED